MISGEDKSDLAAAESTLWNALHFIGHLVFAAVLRHVTDATIVTCVPM